MSNTVVNGGVSLLSATAAAKYLNLSLSTFRRMVDKGIFSAVRVPGFDPKYSADVLTEELAKHIDAPRAQQR